MLSGWLGFVLLSASFGGCGGDKDEVGSRVVFSGGENGIDVGTGDSSRNDAEIVAGCEDEAAGCGIEVEKERSSCETAFDFGVLVAGQIATAEAEVGKQGSWLKTRCSVDGTGSEVVFHLKVSTPMRLNFEIVDTGGFDAVMALRAGDCSSDGAAHFCTDSESQDFVAEAGNDYFLVVEARSGGEISPFTLKVEASSAVCAPAGEWRCEGTARVQCFGGIEERVFECAGSCEAGLCRGDSCDNALIVAESTTFIGKTAGYSNRFDFSEQLSCSSSGATGMRTVGQDIVFFLPNLRAGQTVFVDAATGDTNDNLIAVLDRCSTEAGCVAASSSGNQLRWKVESSGDYYVIIDKTTATARDFQYRIEINP